MTVMENSIVAGNSANSSTTNGVTISPTQKIELTFAATVNQDVLANQTITKTVQVTATELITPVQASNLMTVIAPTLAISDVTVSKADANAVFQVTLSPRLTCNGIFYYLREYRYRRRWHPHQWHPYRSRRADKRRHYSTNHR